MSDLSDLSDIVPRAVTNPTAKSVTGELTGRFTDWCAKTITLMLVVHPALAGELTIDDALATARLTGRPILAIVSSPSCGPCRELRRVIHEDQDLRPLLNELVLLEMDAAGDEYQRFVRRFPGQHIGIPIVYLIGADGNVVYGCSGFLTGQQLRTLLVGVFERSREVFAQAQLVSFQEVVRDARLAAERGELARALQLVYPVAAEPIDADVVLIARSYRDQLVPTIDSWLSQLKGRMERLESPHGTAFQIAELYAQLPATCPRLRESAGRLLDRYEQRPETRLAVQQARGLVQAQIEESRDLAADAIRSYEHVVNLDPNSPAGLYARERLPALRGR
jgi:thioredoxin-like negative regulator of GroEL